MDGLSVGAGTVLAGRYALERPIGRGGMATVYLAQDLRQRRPVAIKILRPNVALGSDRFLREIEIASHLTHPHILPLHDSGEAEGLLFYVMPYLDGESLRERVEREGPLPVEEAVQITREVAGALAYAHGLGIVHRDIKPGNILLVAGNAVVADFGIARAISVATEGRLTSDGLVVGTPVYMSPEQASGADPVDRRSDIYALGCVLYEMLTGEPPFHAATPQAVVALHRSAPLPPVHTVRPSVPAWVEAALTKALAKLPADRYAGAAEFADALRAPPQGAPLEGTPIPGARRWAPVAALAVLAGALLVTILTRVPWRSSAPGPVPLAVVVFPFDPPAEPGDSAGSPAHVVFAETLNWVPGFRGIQGTVPGGSDRSWRAVPLEKLLRAAASQGGRYLVTGVVMPTAGGRSVRVDAYTVPGGERVMRSEERAEAGGVAAPVGRLALQAVRMLAARDRLSLESRRSLLDATTSAVALGYLVQGQSSIWAGDFAEASASFQQAVGADSSCGLAYLRWSVAEELKHDFPAALAAAESGLRRRHGMDARWTTLLEGQRSSLRGEGDSAIARFQQAVLDHREEVDGWYGLAESLFHFAGFSGHTPADARPAFERLISLDSTFAPIYYHLVDLAIYRGDSAGAVKYLAGMAAIDPWRPGREAAIALRFGGAAGHSQAMRRLQTADRRVLTELVAFLVHDSFDLGLADSVARLLMGPSATPDDRQRGADLRLIALAAQGRWDDAVAAWRPAAGVQPFDAWVVHASLAGYPAGELAAPMLQWARGVLSSGRTPDFRLPLWEDTRQAFTALVHLATLRGDSVEVLDLLRRIESAPVGVGDPDPQPETLAASLQARLALLAGDTTKAIQRLERAVGRVPEPYVWYFPLTAMAPQRALLADLLAASGDSVRSRRWRESFRETWSVGDALYAVQRRARDAAALPPTTH